MFVLLLSGKNFLFFSSSSFSFFFSKPEEKKDTVQARESWEQLATSSYDVKDEACSINACTCELPSSRASTLDFLAVSRPGFASLVSLPRVMYRSIHESMNILP